MIGESPIVDPERAGLSVNINNQALTSVPVTTNRRFQDAWLVVPGVAINPATQELTGSERRTSLDGADVTDPYGGDIFAVNLNYDAIQDVEIKALGAEAADGSSMVGQFMNIVTKSGVQGIPANRRKDIQPDTTLGGPILRNRAWFFGSFRRVQQDKTLNNAPVPVEMRGNLWFAKGTMQPRNDHRLSVSFQYDKVNQKNAVIRGLVAPGRTLGSTTTGLSSSTMQITNPSAFGTLIKGGPLASFNYNWVMSSTRLFQFVGSFMFNKPNDYEPNDGALTPTKIIQSNPAGNILGSLTTIAQEGGFGAVDTSHRSMVYLSPSITLMADTLGSHEFRGGADLYPNIENDTSSNLVPVEYYFRPPGTTGSQDILFERDTLRNLDGTGATIANKAYEHHYAMYFQDRWKPSSKVAIKAGVRVETNKIYTADREKVLGSLLAPGTPTNIADLEFHQWVTMPNFGIAYNADKWGVFRGTMGRGYEWLDLGGGDGTSHAPYVLAADVFRANPRTSPTLNQALPGGFPLGLNFGGTPDDVIHNGRTYVNWCDVPVAPELGLSERRRPERDSRSENRRAARTSVSAVRRDPQHVQPELHVAAEQVDSAPLHAQLRRQLGSERELLVHLPGDVSHAVESDEHDGPPVLRHQPGGRHHDAEEPAQSRAVVHVRQAAVRHDVLGVLPVYGPEPLRRADRTLPAERNRAERHAVERARGVGSVLQHPLPAREKERRGHADRGRLAPREPPAPEGSAAGNRPEARAQRRCVQPVQRRGVDRFPLQGRPGVELRCADQLCAGAGGTARPAADLLTALVNAD
ncbi:MAG: hypothetical protein AUJ01_15865 [Acidobacteria bacterium 13_1_40CM_3_65_5]|nr:MAG: hypothetical protein AUJ01_15865 [Acidobacteria bacterium 13_1_40CM_3_65_5]